MWLIPFVYHGSTLPRDGTFDSEVNLKIKKPAKPLESLKIVYRLIDVLPAKESLVSMNLAF